MMHRVAAASTAMGVRRLYRDGGLLHGTARKRNEPEFVVLLAERLDQAPQESASLPAQVRAMDRGMIRVDGRVAVPLTPGHEAIDNRIQDAARIDAFSSSGFCRIDQSDQRSYLVPVFIRYVVQRLYLERLACFPGPPGLSSSPPSSARSQRLFRDTPGYATATDFVDSPDRWE